MRKGAASVHISIFLSEVVETNVKLTKNYYYYITGNIGAIIWIKNGRQLFILYFIKYEKS